MKRGVRDRERDKNRRGRRLSRGSLRRVHEAREGGG